MRNNGQSALTITSLKPSMQGVNISIDKRMLQPQETAKLKLTIDRSALLSARSQPSVLLTTNDPKRQKAVIKIKVN